MLLHQVTDRSLWWPAQWVRIACGNCKTKQNGKNEEKIKRRSKREWNAKSAKKRRKQQRKVQHDAVYSPWLNQHTIVSPFFRNASFSIHKDIQKWAHMHSLRSHSQNRSVHHTSLLRTTSLYTDGSLRIGTTCLMHTTGCGWKVKGFCLSKYWWTQCFLFYTVILHSRETFSLKSSAVTRTEACPTGYYIKVNRSSCFTIYEPPSKVWWPPSKFMLLWSLCICCDTFWMEWPFHI